MSEDPLAPFTIEEQIACVQRELELRRRVYPRWVADHKISQSKADTEIACMRAVLNTLSRMLGQ